MSIAVSTVANPFAPVLAELAQWQSLNRPCTLWWRDDDLVQKTPELQRMSEISQKHKAAVLVAVIPAMASASLAEDTAPMYTLVFCQHGLSHTNHETGAIKSEFGFSRNLADIEADIMQGHARMQTLFGPRFFPVFVPPWNTLSPSALPLLEKTGLRGLSQYVNQPRLPPNTQLTLVNTHIDIMDWGTRPCCVQEYAILATRLTELLQQRRTGASVDEPIGILTHHRVMQDDAWQFMEMLFAVTANFPCVSWLTPHQVFSGMTARLQAGIA